MAQKQENYLFVDPEEAPLSTGGDMSPVYVALMAPCTDYPAIKSAVSYRLIFPEHFG